MPGILSRYELRRTGQTDAEYLVDRFRTLTAPECGMPAQKTTARLTAKLTQVEPNTIDAQDTNRPTIVTVLRCDDGSRFLTAHDRAEAWAEPAE